MDGIVQQRCKNDCCLASLCMYSNEDYANLLSLFDGHDFESIGLTEEQISDAMRKINDKKIHIYHDKFPLGQRAILIVKSLNVSGSYHCVFWNGYEVLDPLTGRQDKKTYTTKFLLTNLSNFASALFQLS
ncbi:Uncharacterised protein [uncultured archaeon]|nr:Uncharacterised protein [uncultured archaeon]